MKNLFFKSFRQVLKIVVCGILLSFPFWGYGQSIKFGLNFGASTAIAHSDIADGILPTLSVYDTQTEFVKNKVELGVPNPNLPKQELLNYYPFSALGLNIGLSLEL